MRISREECWERWQSHLFYEFVEHYSLKIPRGEWVAYENYMQAILIDCIEGEVGKLIVDFPSNSTEDNRLHTHPLSDRVVTVIRGCGFFICYRNQQLEKYPLFPGIRVWMPRGILHTFKSREEGLLVESVHNPFVPLDSPNCLRYPKKELF